MFNISELSALQTTTSPARLSSYSSYLGTNNLSEAFGAYMWSMAVSTAFTPMIQTLEVGLRNAMHSELSKHAGGNNWFEHWVAIDANDQRANGMHPSWKSTNERKIQDAKDKIKQRAFPNNSAPAGYVPAPQKVLAEMTFGFWTSLLAKRFYDVNHNTKLWPQHLSAVFPGAPSSMHAVGKLKKFFDEAVDLRNRIHHHEPLWKHSSVSSSNDALQYLIATLHKTLEKMDYLNPVLRQSVERFGIFASIQELCRPDTFDRFIGRGHGACLPLNAAKKDLRLIGKSITDTESVWITSSRSVRMVVRHGSRRFF